MKNLLIEPDNGTFSLTGHNGSYVAFQIKTGRIFSDIKADDVSALRKLREDLEDAAAQLDNYITDLVITQAEEAAREDDSAAVKADQQAWKETNQ